MNAERRHKIYGSTESEWIASTPVELDIDAVGLWQIEPAGRQGFGLEGEELANHIRRNIYALIEAGAIPVYGGGDGPHDWIYQPQYGKTKEEIAENVINEWLAKGGGETTVSDVWFARPGDVDIDIAPYKGKTTEKL